MSYPLPQSPATQGGNTRLILTLMSSVAISLMGLGVVVPLMPVFAQDLGASGLWLGLMLAAFSISRGVIQPFIGVLSDKYGRKRFIVAGLAIYSIISFVYILAQSPFDLTLMRLVHGAGSAMVIPIITASLGDITPPDKEGQYMGYLNIAIFGGLGAGPLVGGLLNDNVGLESAFVLMGALSAVSLILIVWLLPPGKGTGPSEGSAGFAQFRKALLNNRVRGMLSFRLFTAISFGPTYAFLPVLMDDWFQASSLAIGLAITLRILASAVLQVPFGYLADRMNRVLLATTGAVGLGVLVLLIPFTGSIAMVTGVLMVMGVFEGLTWAAIQAMSVHEGRRYGQGSVQGLVQTSMSIGLLIGSFFGGMVMDISGIGSTFVLAGVLVGTGSVLSAFIMMAPQKPLRPEYAEAAPTQPAR